MIAYRKQERIDSYQRIKKGMVHDGKLRLKNEISFQGCLVKVKGTNDYIKNKRKEIVFSQLQNGTINLKLFWKVFGGFSAIQSDTQMAMSLLRTKGYKFSSMIKRSESFTEKREYRLCCEDKCDPFNCTLQAYHQTPLDVLSSCKEEIDPLSVSRFVNEKVNAFVNKCVKPIAKSYSLFLMFNRPSQEGGDSSIFLCGHIWTDQSEESDLIPEILRKHTGELLGDCEEGLEMVQDLVTWPDHLYSKEDQQISHKIFERLQPKELDNLRETSIFEAIFCSGRGMSISWSDLNFTYINTNDQRKVNI